MVWRKEGRRIMLGDAGQVEHGTQLVGTFLGKAWEISFSDILLAFSHLPYYSSSSPGFSFCVFPSFFCENVISIENLSVFLSPKNATCSITLRGVL